MNITSYLTKGLFHAQTIFITSDSINLGIARHFAAVGANLDIVGRSNEKTRRGRHSVHQG